jgi:hypothetical protein
LKLKNQGMTYKDLLTDFFYESMALFSLRHPNIVKIIGITES